MYFGPYTSGLGSQGESRVDSGCEEWVVQLLPPLKNTKKKKII
jgi:hypothetical protein